MIRSILQLPDPVLRRVSKPVAKIDDEIKKLIKDMFETMYDAPGVGLAAVQIGVAKRVVTIDATRGEEEKDPMVFINPEIISSSEDVDVKEEGCLSIAEFYEEVERPSAVTVRYMDEKGKTQRDRSRRLARARFAARDRSSERRLVHRSYFEIEARSRDQEIHESGESDQTLSCCRLGSGLCALFSSAHLTSQCRRLPN